MPSRFYYVVRPAETHWEVCVGLDGARIRYGSANEALQVARGAARLHWEARSEPSGVLVEQRDASAREEALFG
jgi:hypothetical protein